VTTDFTTESENLRNAWLRHPAGFLDSYLIQGVENPCINPQSVVTRSLLVDTLMPGAHRDLAEQEMLYSACACTTIAAAGRGLFDLFTAALEGEPGADAALPLPTFLKKIRDERPQLPFSLRGVWQQIFHAIMNSYNGFASPFEPLWRERLAAIKDVQPTPAGQTPSPPLEEKDRMRGIGQKADEEVTSRAHQSSAQISSRPTLLEVACGSANDFRYFPRYGLDTLINYTGADICPTNVANAQRRCPTGTFLEGNALALPFPDKSFDFYLTFDLFEHLSLAAMQQALREAVRVTRRKLWLSFFSLEDRPEHLEVPSPPYYLNVLSIARTVEELSRLGCDATVIDLPADWSHKFPGYQHYNPRARIIEARIRG
jgi:SAM-dependent methyltransferase